MIVEERIYTLKPMTAPQFLKVAEEGAAIQQEILGKPLGYFSTEFGPQNQIVHLWVYKDVEERAQRRAALAADPRWAQVRPRLGEFLVSQENKLLIPAKFAPIIR